MRIDYSVARRHDALLVFPAIALECDNKEETFHLSLAQNIVSDAMDLDEDEYLVPVCICEQVEFNEEAQRIQVLLRGEGEEVLRADLQLRNLNRIINTTDEYQQLGGNVQELTEELKEILDKSLIVFRGSRTGSPRIGFMASKSSEDKKDNAAQESAQEIQQKTTKAEAQEQPPAAQTASSQKAQKTPASQRRSSPAASLSMEFRRRR